jgi:predicted acyl esterase
VWPDGSSHPVATGRLSNAYPRIDRSRSLTDRRGRVVQPYGDYSRKSPAPAGAERGYQIEFWPIGNRFKRGHRVRLTIIGASAASRPDLPAINTVRLGASRLLLPAVPAG